MSTPADNLIAPSRELGAKISRLSFRATPIDTDASDAPMATTGAVTHVYNPLEYAREPWEAYLHLAASAQRRVVFLGMNPGPWGMAQTGVPFGEITAVSEWMGITAVVGTPAQPHPKRPIQGFECLRSEVSGRRFWGLMQERFGSAERFFAGHFVANYCPLVFMAESGRNVTPDKLPAAQREPLFRLCNDYLIATLDALKPQFAIGVGKFAEKRIRVALAEAGRPVGSDSDEGDLCVGSILHPSPASPAANRGWSEVATRQLVELGVW